MTTAPDLRPVLARYDSLARADGTLVTRQLAELTVRQMSGGLINDTFQLGDDHVVQRLHPIFGAKVNEDIATLTVALRDAGVPVPRLCPCGDGRPYVELDQAHDTTVRGVWRVMTLLPGNTVHRLRNASQARSAARMVGRFHHALAEVEHEFAFTRPGAHDTDAHMQSVVDAIVEQPLHPLAGDVRRLATELRRLWARWSGPTSLPKRICHGDWKVSNLLFDDAGEACGVIDLDTMAHLELDIELGDALRSWCNRAPEDSNSAVFDAAIFASAVVGYIETMGAHLTDDELAAIVPGLQRICLELSARFGADALRESYFGWNPDVAESRGQHNLMRAQGQLDLARQVTAARSQLESVIRAMQGN